MNDAQPTRIRLALDSIADQDRVNVRRVKSVARNAIQFMKVMHGSTHWTARDEQAYEHCLAAMLMVKPHEKSVDTEAVGDGEQQPLLDTQELIDAAKDQS